MITIRWIYFILTSIPYTNSLLTKGGNILNNTPLGNVAQPLLMALQDYICNSHPGVFAFGVSHWPAIQSFGLWFWNALLIVIPLFLLGFRLIWKSGTGILKWISDRIPDIKRAGNRFRGAKQDLMHREAKEEHLILHSVIAGKEQVFDLGAERSICLTDHVVVNLREDQPYLVFSNGKSRPFTDYYHDKDRDLFVEVIHVTI